MVTVKKWHISMKKEGTPELIYWDDKFCFYRHIYLSSEKFTITGDGVEFDNRYLGGIEHFVCPYANVIYESVPAPTDRLLEYKMIKRREMHVLSFLHDLFSGVLHERNFASLKDEPMNIDAILAKYSELNDQIASIDWKTVVTMI